MGISASYVGFSFVFTGGVSYPSSDPVAMALGLQIVAASNAAPASSSTVVPSIPTNQNGTRSSASFALSTQFFAHGADISSANVTGSAAVPVGDIILGGSGDSYVTNGTAVSTVIVDDTVSAFLNSTIGDTIINATPGAALLCATGKTPTVSMGNTLEGLAGANQFITGIAGRDAVLLDGAANSLTSNGNDVVLVGGPSTISAAGTGTDNVTVTAATTLAFFNTSNSGIVESVTGGAGGIVLMAGPGSTSVTAGAGQEFFFLDTSAGNTTINANNSQTAALTFIKDLDGSSARTTVNNFAPGGTVAVHGYSGFNVNQSGPAAAGSVLSLSDGTQVTFNGLSTTALTAAIRLV